MKVNDYVLMLEEEHIPHWSLICITTFDSIQNVKYFSVGNVHGHTPSVYVHWQRDNKNPECSVLGFFSPRNDTGEHEFRASHEDVRQLGRFIGVLNENLSLYQMAMI